VTLPLLGEEPAASPELRWQIDAAPVVEAERLDGDRQQTAFSRLQAQVSAVRSAYSGTARARRSLQPA